MPITAASLIGGHGSPRPAWLIWPNEMIKLCGSKVRVLSVDTAPDFEGEPQVAIHYRVEFAKGSLTGRSVVNARRLFDIIDDGEVF